MFTARLLLTCLLVLFVSACGSGSRSDPPEIAPEPTAVPRNLTVIDVASESVTLRWEPIETAEAYYLYYASEPFEDVNNIHAYRDGEWQADVSSPYKVTGLTNNTTYYFLVTAMIDGAESPPGFSVNATPVDTLSGPQPSAEEVRVIELINRARRDPEQEVERHSQVNDLNEGLDPPTLTATQKAPLAFNPHLMAAARDHSDWMLETNTFSHIGANGQTPHERIAQTEYARLHASAENISVIGRSTLNRVQVIDDHHNQLFASPGHRATMLAEQFREVAGGEVLGPYTFEQGTLPSSMLTQKYALNRDRLFITGVVYSDANENNFYDVGEGMENVVVTVNGSAHRAYDSGIYSVAVSANSVHRVTISGGILPEPVEQEVEVMSRNVKLDVLVVGDEVRIDYW